MPWKWTGRHERGRVVTSRGIAASWLLASAAAGACHTNSGDTQGADSARPGAEDARVSDPTLSEDAGSPGGSDAAVSCDDRLVLCKRAPPDCPLGRLPEVVDACWGGCVESERCLCHSSDECVDPDRYFCYAGDHCSLFVN